MAVDKLRDRLLRSTGALRRHNVPFAVIGGHAVAVHVARVDDDAVRNTIDVDILIRRADLSRAAVALKEVGFDQAEVMGATVFLERDRPSPRRGIQIVFAGEHVRPHEPLPAPDIAKVEYADEGFAVIDLIALVVMKLTANRDKDRVHIRDMLELKMITPDLESQLPPVLRARLDAIRADPQ